VSGHDISVIHPLTWPSVFKGLQLKAQKC
jgi:hypothetical protein